MKSVKLLVIMAYIPTYIVIWLEHEHLMGFRNFLELVRDRMGRLIPLKTVMTTALFSCAKPGVDCM